MLDSTCSRFKNKQTSARTIDWVWNYSATTNLNRKRLTLRKSKVDISPTKELDYENEYYDEIEVQ